MRLSRPFGKPLLISKCFQDFILLHNEGPSEPLFPSSPLLGYDICPCYQFAIDSFDTNEDANKVVLKSSTASAGEKGHVSIEDEKSAMKKVNKAALLSWHSACAVLR